SRSSLYLCERQPVTYTLSIRPCSLASTYCKMVSIDSCLALSINPQVLMITILWSRAFSASCAAVIPFPLSWVNRTCESTRFLEQPMVTILTLSFFNVLVFNLFYFDAKVRKFLWFDSLTLFTVTLLPSWVMGQKDFSVI